MRLAVRARYLKGDTKDEVRKSLLQFFGSAAPEVVTPSRRVEELPYHMMQCGDMTGLLRFCLDIGNVRYLLARHRSDLRHCDASRARTRNRHA